MKVCSATIPNTLKQKRRKTHQVKPTSIIPESSYDLNTLNKNRRCARTWLSLCANAIWCVLETRTLEERRRPSHASASGGWRGDTACWNSVLKWGRKGKMRWRPSQLHWSDPPILTRTRRQPHDKHTRRRQVVIFCKRIWAEMNTNDAKEYLARREIPQLFEVRRRMRALRWCSFSDLFKKKKISI